MNPRPTLPKPDADFLRESRRASRVPERVEPANLEKLADLLAPAKGAAR